MSQSVRSAPALYLPGVEANPQPGAYATLIANAKSRGDEYSKIWDLFAYQQDVTIHLARFTQGVMRQPASITPALRELIAAYTSYLNECAFCTRAHAAAAAELFGNETFVWMTLRNLEDSPIEERSKTLLRFVAKVTKNLPGVERADIETVRAAGWDDEAIYFAITSCALFNFYNRWITATGVPPMSDDGHRGQGRMLATRGYGRD
jgi:uncharacterized peroxidase-related enzyme